ncbi:nucleoside triphosphate pyrophosphohydrolase [Microbulbifer sp. TYP-18]|uniref:nucleoside triphosphate pyrophosphohydrolase n=1 Tax=Microbulbifer sp. TYP-18 TaxID=3230024 RepID=UPI0034C5F51B
MEDREKYTLDDLLFLMERLRDPESGCPWDRKQDFASIAPSTIEEAYEVAEAIETADFEHLREELGDLLFQVVFYAQLGREQGRFDFSRIVDSLAAKLLRRHPHVFPGGSLYADSPGNSVDQSTVRQNWESIKAAERDARGQGGALDGVATGLPALTRAGKLQKRAARVGFDWPDLDRVLDKVEEELSELRQAVAAGDCEHAREELGDLLFSCVNAARHLQAEPEGLLRGCNRKFERRFRAMEDTASRGGRRLSDLSADQLEALWVQAKAGEK